MWPGLLCSLRYSTVHNGTLHMMLHCKWCLRGVWDFALHFDHVTYTIASTEVRKLLVGTGPNRIKSQAAFTATLVHMSDDCSRSGHRCYDLCFAMSLSFTKAYDASGSAGLDISVHVKVLVWTKTMIEKHQNCTCSSANVQPCIDRRIAWDPLLRCGLKII